MKPPINTTRAILLTAALSALINAQAFAERPDGRFELWRDADSPRETRLAKRIIYIKATDGSGLTIELDADELVKSYRNMSELNHRYLKDIEEDEWSFETADTNVERMETILIELARNSYDLIQKLQGVEGEKLYESVRQLAREDNRFVMDYYFKIRLVKDSGFGKLTHGFGGTFAAAFGAVGHFLSKDFAGFFGYIGYGVGTTIGVIPDAIISAPKKAFFFLFPRRIKVRCPEDAKIFELKTEKN